MENASKALIIAGAILIAILLISVGIVVMNSINAPLDEAKQKSDSQAAQIFNSKYQKYTGPDKTAQDAKQLIMLVNSNTDQKHKIGFFVASDNSDGKDKTKIEDINNNATYRIVIYMMNTKSGTSNVREAYSGTISYPDGSTYETTTGEFGYVFMVRIHEN